MIRLIPTFMYKAQGRFDQLDLGAYIISNPLLLGVWYRGILIKEDEGITNNDALTVQAGVKF